jgi:cell division topological specificity factor MinE
MMISTLLDRLFHRNAPPSGTQVAQRLKLILAHDRAALTPKMFDDLRQEIMSVVSKYVEIDEKALDIRLESDRRCTAVIANLPIRALREEEPETAPVMNTGELLSSEFVAQNDRDKPPLTPVVITAVPEPKPTGAMVDSTALVAEFAAGLEDSPILNEPASAPEVAVTEVVSDAAISDPATNGDQLQLDLGDGNIGDEQLKLDLGTTTASDVEAKDTAVTDVVVVAEVVPTVDPVVAVSETRADSDVSGDEAPTYKPD